ncbi:MAG TPA: hypothetical protein VFL82_13075 [Thermomicrobiales bacterium]|nr:hypothetical protein [Thermomicrobiales bacterium]
MRYEVHYLAGGEEHAQEIEAPDAAEAASIVENAAGETDAGFELLSINLLDPLAGANSNAENSDSAAGD